MKKILLFILLLPSLASAYSLDVMQGITVYTINGNKPSSESSDKLQVIAGTNQISIRFDGKLRDQGKSTQYESLPYLITIDVTSDIEIKTASFKYNTIMGLEAQNKPIFKINTPIIEQKVLPTTSNILPYSNIPALVSHYNEVNGIYFSDNGLEQLSANEIVKQQEAKESKVLAQLKYWYSQASKEEISAFENWKNK